MSRNIDNRTMLSDLLIAVRNGQRTEDIAGHYEMLYGKLTTVINAIAASNIKRDSVYTRSDLLKSLLALTSAPLTTMERMFLKDLIQVFTTGDVTHFGKYTYLVVTGAERPTVKKLAIRVSDMPQHASNLTDAEQFAYLAHKVGSENLICIIHCLANIVLNLTPIKTRVLLDVMQWNDKELFV